MDKKEETEKKRPRRSKLKRFYRSRFILKLRRFIRNFKKWIKKHSPINKKKAVPELMTLDQIFHAPDLSKKFLTPLKVLIFAILFVAIGGTYAWIHLIYHQNTVFKDSSPVASQETTPSSVKVEPIKIDDKETPLKKEEPKVAQVEVQDTSFTMQPYLKEDVQRSLIRTINPQFFIQSADNRDQKVAILIVGLGINQTLSEQIIAQVPKSVSLVFSPYTPDLDDVLDMAIGEDFAVLVAAPLEDEDSTTDQGYLTLKTRVPEEVNLEILKKLALHASDVDCIYGQGGARLLRAPQSLSPILESLRQINNCFVAPPDVLVNQFHEVAAATRLNYVSTTIENPTESMMPSITALTQRTGFSVLAFDARPGVEETIKQWIKMLEDAKISIVPITEIIHS